MKPTQINQSSTHIQTVEKFIPIENISQYTDQHQYCHRPILSCVCVCFFSWLWPKFVGILLRNNSFEMWPYPLGVYFFKRTYLAKKEYTVASHLSTSNRPSCVCVCVQINKIPLKCSKHTQKQSTVKWEWMSNGTIQTRSHCGFGPSFIPFHPEKCVW